MVRGEPETETAEVLLGEKTEEGYWPVGIETSRGVTSTRWYSALHASSAVLYVGGVGGGFDSPAQDLYRRLCEELVESGVSGLRVKFRNPVDLDEGAFDVVAGIAFLSSQGITRVGLVGHSFGGAVVIRAGTVSSSVRTVVAISTQGYGTEIVGQLPKECSLLLVHGEGDQVLPSSMSEFVYEHAHEPKELRIVPGGSHVLDEVADEIDAEVRTWLLGELGGPARP